MQEEIVKVCPACGSEFQMRMERCLDCGASLVLSLPGADPGDAFEEREEPVVPPDCIHLRTAAVGWLRGLSEDLDDAGIRHWVTASEWRRDPSLYILPSDLEAALRVDRARYEVEVPGVTLEDALPQTPVRPRRRAPADDLDVKLCPRCGGEYQLWVEVCADCGVALVRPWDFESAQRKEVARAAVPAVSAASMASEDPGACPACGERLRDGEPECPGCGLTLAQPDVCPNCGVELEPHVGRCVRCGEDLFETAES